MFITHINRIDRPIILTQLLTGQQRHPEHSPVNLLTQRDRLLRHTSNLIVGIAPEDADVEVDGEEPFYGVRVLWR